MNKPKGVIKVKTNLSKKERDRIDKMLRGWHNSKVILICEEINPKFIKL